MLDAAEKPISLDAFLAWERQQPDRHEFDGFTIVAMTGGSAAHVKITMNLAFALRQLLRGSGCRPFASDAKVIVAGSVRYPDIVVSCKPVADQADVIPEPVVIFEVVLPNTAHVDRGLKKREYFATPSIQHYAIVSQDERLIDLYTRTAAGWINDIVAETGVLNLSTLGVELPLDAIYEDTELDATPRPAADGSVPAV